MKAWFARVRAWLATHPWPIVATLGSVLVLVLFRRRPSPSTAEKRIARDVARADTKRDDAAKLEPKVEVERVEIAKTEKRLQELEAPSREDVKNVSDEEVANRFSDSGL